MVQAKATELSPITLAPYLIEFLELNELGENVLKNVPGVPGGGRQLGCHIQDVTTLPYIVLKVLIFALVGHLQKINKPINIRE